MRRIAPLLLACLLAVSCGGAPDVDWSQVPQNQARQIEQAVADEDCTKMQTYFDGSKNADVLDYLDWHMREAGCY